MVNQTTPKEKKTPQLKTCHSHTYNTYFTVTVMNFHFHFIWVKNYFWPVVFPRKDIKSQSTDTTLSEWNVCQLHSRCVWVALVWTDGCTDGGMSYLCHSWCEVLCIIKIIFTFVEKQEAANVLLSIKFHISNIWGF